jgi:hypothetical protein
MNELVVSIKGIDHGTIIYLEKSSKEPLAGCSLCLA